jgi:plastocyanin
VVVVEATDFAFSPSTLSLAEGEEIVLRIVNKGSVEHNISIPPLGLSLTASPGEAVETRLIVPEPSRAGAFTCTLPGHAEAGMTGEIRIEADASTSASPPPVPDRIEFDETSGTPSLITAGVLALGMFLGMMAIVFGLLQFMKLEEQR